MIEPPSQSSLLDATMKIPGVVATGVPGAGGYDAVFSLCLTESSAVAVTRLWESWCEDGMRVSVLESRNDVQGGLRIETEIE